jgi:hypothetical protein
MVRLGEGDHMPVRSRDAGGLAQRRDRMLQPEQDEMKERYVEGCPSKG